MYLILENHGYDGFDYRIIFNKNDIKEILEKTDSLGIPAIFEVKKRIVANAKLTQSARIKKNSIIEIPELDMKIKYLGWRR